jgi:hypothetical protein
MRFSRDCHAFVVVGFEALASMAFGSLLGGISSRAVKSETGASEGRVRRNLERTRSFIASLSYRHFRFFSMPAL